MSAPQKNKLHSAHLYAPSSMSSKRTSFYAALFSISHFFQFCYSIHTITSSQFISDAKNEILLSHNGNFKMGFFSLGNSLNRYVGIWFNKIPEQNIVWVANRETPLKKKDGVLKITDKGNIAIFSGKNGRDFVWSSNVSMAITANITAKLLSSGNLVLTMINRSGRVDSVVWQSFDHPTDMILAEMKIGLDRRTGLNRVLTSWKSEEDPAAGEYSAAVEPHGPPQLIVYKNSAPSWRGGPWNGQILSGMLTVASRLKTYKMDYTSESSLFSSTYINNTDEVCITFASPKPEIFGTFILDITGIVRQQLYDHASPVNATNKQEWSRFWVAPKDECDKYMRCGPSTICNSYNVMECTL